MATTMMLSRQREKTMVMRTRFLFEIYMREGNAHVRNRQYRKAIESYDSALQLNSFNMAAIVGKSQCHLRLGHVKQALADVEMALAIDNINPSCLVFCELNVLSTTRLYCDGLDDVIVPLREVKQARHTALRLFTTQGQRVLPQKLVTAVLQKADILYTLHNYEMALLFYHRGHKVNPEVISFQDGITNCQRHISDLDNRKAMKMTEAGDLTIYVHKMMRKMTKPGESRDKRQVNSPPRIPFRQPSSAESRSRKKEVNPLVRLGRKQPIKLTLSTKRTNQKKRNKPGSRASGGTVFSEPDEKTMKEILGKMYGDRVYLQNFLRDTDEEESRLDAEVSVIAENGLQFLLDRVTYWNHRRLPPAPTPSPPLSRKRSRQGSSTQRMATESPLPRQKSSLWEREISDLIRELNYDNSHEDSVAEDTIVGYRPYKKEKKKVRKLYFEFATYRPGSDIGERERGGTGVDRQNVKQQTQMTDIEEEEEEGEEEDYVLNYLTKELTNIENAFDQEDFEQCKRMSVTCLQTVYNYSEDDIADKLDVIAKIHSILGNVLLEQGDIEESQQHHEKDLEIGEKCNLHEAVSRALGNLGRVFVQGKHFHRALGAFARKAKLVERPIEIAWLFHEIGDCFLTLNQYEYARDAGRKSLLAAEDAQHRMYQLQAYVLIGVAHVKLREYDDAYLHFERALDFARIEGDRDSEEMIVRALKEVNLRISERTRKQTERVQGAQRTSPGGHSLEEEERQTTSARADDNHKVQLEIVQEVSKEKTETDGFPDRRNSRNTDTGEQNHSSPEEDDRTPVGGREVTPKSDNGNHSARQESRLPPSESELTSTPENRRQSPRRDSVDNSDGDGHTETDRTADNEESESESENSEDTGKEGDSTRRTDDPSHGGVNRQRSQESTEESPQDKSRH